MNEFEFVLWIIGIVFGAGLIRHHMSLKHDSEPPSGDDVERLADLEARVRTLEEIVTDQGYEVRKAFRDLERGEDA